MMPEVLLFVLIIVGLVTVFTAWMTMSQDTGVLPFAIVCTIIWLGLVYCGHVWITGPKFGTYGKREVELVWRDNTVYLQDYQTGKIYNALYKFGVIPEKGQKAYADYSKGGSYAGVWSSDSDVPEYHLEKVEPKNAEKR